MGSVEMFQILIVFNVLCLAIVDSARPFQKSDAQTARNNLEQVPIVELSAPRPGPVGPAYSADSITGDANDVEIHTVEGSHRGRIGGDEDGSEKSNLEDTVNMVASGRFTPVELGNDNSNWKWNENGEIVQEASQNGNRPLDLFKYKLYMETLNSEFDKLKKLQDRLKALISKEKQQKP